MKEKFKKYLKNSIPWYEYINNAKYILMWASEDGNIHYSTATTNYVDLLDFPRSEKEYQNPEEVLAEEMNDNNAIFGIIIFKSHRPASQWQIIENHPIDYADCSPEQKHFLSFDFFP